MLPKLPLTSNQLDQARTCLLQLMQKRYTSEAYGRRSYDALNKEALIAELNESVRVRIDFRRSSLVRLLFRTTRPRIEKLLGGKNVYLRARRCSLYPSNSKSCNSR